ncbi:probable transmembrane ascorbate ferrireductase 3 [Macadamia integrifolia]|uniref:probable transmembrane ascorbate ferrireductase 3 n=1 Tax=Macadamia integrifolia TaxID=60698 RepID=UPI001C533821|nr:probable transmembrane ascorbate ferrireductase 3 [Macadamia integrifolia]
MAFVATASGHIFGILALILLLAWLIHFRGGIDLNSSDAAHIFNVHPFLMYFGFVFFAGEAIMAYKTVRVDWKAQKFVHMSLHVIAIVLGIVGIYAAFKYHKQQGIANMYSLHSWLGLGTFIIYGLQWIFGFFYFWVQGADASARRSYAIWHIFFGRVLLYMAICTAESGLMQSSTLLGLGAGTESRIVNFAGLAILLFGISADLAIAPIPDAF